MEESLQRERRRKEEEEEWPAKEGGLMHATENQSGGADDGHKDDGPLRVYLRNTAKEEGTMQIG